MPARCDQRLSNTVAGAAAGLFGSALAYTARDAEHVAWLLLRSVTDCTYTAHGWLPSRNASLLGVVMAGFVCGAVGGALPDRDVRWAVWLGFAAGFVGQMLVPSYVTVVE
jgi:hypothetical protein